MASPSPASPPQGTMNPVLEGQPSRRRCGLCELPEGPQIGPEVPQRRDAVAPPESGCQMDSVELGSGAVGQSRPLTPSGPGAAKDKPSSKPAGNRAAVGTPVPHGVSGQPSHELKIVKDATCTFCGCVCDDIDLTVEGNHIIEAKRACVLGKAWFLNHDIEDRPACLIDGQPASVDGGHREGGRRFWRTPSIRSSMA